MVIKRPQPIAEQVISLLRTRIRGREYGNGRLPSESELAAELGVSRATIRTALARLGAEGLVSRKQGDGTYINQRILDVQTHIGEIWEFTRLIRVRGYEPTIIPLGIQQRPARKYEAEALCLAPLDEVFSVNRLFLADEKPFVLSENVMTLSLFCTDEMNLDATYSLHEFTERYCGQSIAYAIARIGSVVATPELAGHLRVNVGFPLLHDVETFYNKDEQPLIYANNYYNDKVIEMRLIRSSK
ncbi:MAG: GntR family transcriptional regulator [Anaerolineaceae bacterium]|nr:GntR family transcriptional regulator [Anaerolineaceae bacterium]